MMASLGPHAGFIIAAYGAAVVVLGGLTLAILRDYRLQRRRLADLEKCAGGEPR